MPWTAKSFASKHNHKLHGAAASKAASQATAMVRSGVPEGIAIATANKHADKMQARTNGSSPRSRSEHAASIRGQGTKLHEIGKVFGVSKSTAHRIAKKGYR